MPYVTFVPATAVAVAVFTTATSALTLTAVDAVDVLFAGFGSLAVVDTVAVLLSGPAGADALMFAAIVNVALPLAAKTAMLHVTVPGAPIAGVVHVNVGPVGCDSAANVVFGGSTSVSTTFVAFDGPAFVTVMPYDTLVPADAVAVAVFATATSAVTPTVVGAVELLLPGVGSAVADETVAVFDNGVPFGVAAEMLTTSVKTADAAAGSDAIVHVTAPVPPDAGAVQMNVGPLVCDSDTNVVFAGVVSVHATVDASDGPLFVTVIVYVTFVPAVPLPAATFVIARSALVVTVVFAVPELFPPLGSVDAVDAVAVFVTVEPEGALELMRTTREKTADAPLASDAAVQ
jgi:hypothetical protein